VELQKILLYYCFTPIADPEAVRLWQQALCESLNIKGRILVSKHGINGTVGGDMSALKKYVKTTKAYPSFKKTDFKWSNGTGNDFPRLNVRVKDELVSFGSPTEIEVDINGVINGGKHLKPYEVNKLVEERGDEVVFFDGRNAFEAKIGKFKNAIVPNVESSQEFIREIESGKYDHIKDKPIVTYCTGGIRCEILSAVMIKRGFKEVYQIEGGVVRYGKKYGDKSHWEGSLFTFDARLAVDFSANTKVIGRCERCDTPTKTFFNCKTSTCFELILLCDDCSKLDTNISCVHSDANKRDTEMVG
jgi:UPF0176 protein